ncbi:MAG: hypothetical protein AAF721_10785 [Myxococcota bacterium]
MSQPVAAAFTAPSSKGDPERQRVASLEIDVAGSGGVMTTESEFLDGAGGTYRFGSACGAPASPHIVEHLLSAMRTSAPITVVAETRKDALPPCVKSLVFFAP